MTANTYLAVFLGSKSSPRMAEWNAHPEEERQAKMKEGMAAWKAWAERHQASVVEKGGPLSKTKRVSPLGVEDVNNDMSAFLVVRAASQEEAAKLFEHHPHFAIFPGEGVDVMQVMPIPE